MGRRTRRHQVTRFDLPVDGWPAGDPGRRTSDTTSVEEPLEIRLEGDAYTVTMRTPGDDIDLVVGHLVSQGVVDRREQVLAVRYCSGTGSDGLQTYNVLNVSLDSSAHRSSLGRRSTAMTSACGVCGSESIDDVLRTSHHPVRRTAGGIPLAMLLSLPERLRSRQVLFDRTGGVHAAALFTRSGDLLVVREDVGRHNAVDKVIGWATREGRLPLHDVILQVSGRASFELVQKAAMAGIPVLAAVSAPSSLAVETAHAAGITLAAFSRGTSVTVFAHPERLAVDDATDGAVAVLDPSGRAVGIAVGSAVGPVVSR